ncbi:uncharacterized protein [Penaeus vannamei]|uniref:uncharacterized protein n=1 Tax=Penaeus vannamei TaxID=6689 RepID=UPI00387F7220
MGFLKHMMQTKSPLVSIRVQDRVSSHETVAQGICEIPAELLKCGGETIAHGFHDVLAAIWQSIYIPSDLLRGVFISIWKYQITGLISSLYIGTESAVKCGRDLSSFFPVNSGIRQGCVLAPTLFNTCMNWIMGRATFQRQCGAALGSIKVTDLDFTDNVAILSESLESLVAALDVFSNELLGLQFFWTKYIILGAY